MRVSLETSETPLDPYPPLVLLWYAIATGLKTRGALLPYFFEQGGWSPPCPPGSYAPALIICTIIWQEAFEGKKLLQEHVGYIAISDGRLRHLILVPRNLTFD